MLSLNVFQPPLRYSWGSATGFPIASVSENTLFGITSDGQLTALRASDGSARWQATSTYLSGHLSYWKGRLFAYRANEGLGYVDDTPGGPVETLAVSFGATSGTNLSDLVIDDRMVYFISNLGLYALHQDRGLQFLKLLDDIQPYSTALLASRDIVVVNGKGVPSRYRVSDTAFETVWQGELHGVNGGQVHRSSVLAGNALVVAVPPATVAYDVATGRVIWKLENVPAHSLTYADGVVYLASHGAALWAVDAQSGRVVWQRQFIYDLSIQREYRCILAADYLYYGGVLQNNPDETFLLAVRASDGDFAWMSRSANGDWIGGLPIANGAQLFVHSSHGVGSYVSLDNAPAVPRDAITISPRPLLGPANGFGDGTFSINSPVPIQVSAAPWREQTGVGALIVDRASWSAGANQASWNPVGSGGYTAANQFGYVLVDVTEDRSTRYTQVLLLPVNTFPDIQQHWGRAYIEAMAYHKYLGGYPDQTFRPDNPVKRAESTTIVAKTLGFTTPHAGYRTKFTDIGGHWARNYIMALEEQGIVSGFLEADGTYTFRPEVIMTRAEEAHILVKAYQVPSAPQGFQTSFRDIANHWARADIEALESVGYVNGFQEPDGTHTYRPERSVTRAELAAIIVRIKGL